MKITVELPKDTMCVFINYVFRNPQGGMLIAVKSVETSELYDGNEIKCGEGDEG